MNNQIEMTMNHIWVRLGVIQRELMSIKETLTKLEQDMKTEPKPKTPEQWKAEKLG